MKHPHFILRAYAIIINDHQELLMTMNIFKIPIYPNFLVEDWNGVKD